MNDLAWFEDPDTRDGLLAAHRIGAGEYDYRVFPYRGAWKFERLGNWSVGLPGVALGSRAGMADTAEAAQEAVEEDWRMVHRLEAWITYMATHEPPR
ncbi:hypothetical protein [Mycobacterium sp. PSTR-4-N]|uniref:hypothetical protein n=1 Tax=Mycobacterium sp. PSTR-4-N TaxID=2917745 RepID=UPI001F14A071|nr:hypothetical protein [Mycobacterium sp. PSTR-4-N]MCG7595762.1 hypothetical protein [Mycobacterium sp. PSTR-4-N]